MSLKSFCEKLSEKEQQKLAIILAEKALPIWINYCSINKLEYIDSVVAMYHKVDSDLLKNVLQYLNKRLESNIVQRYFYKKKGLKLLKEFTDPIVSLQDLDWELPYEVEKTFYSFYNLLATSLNKRKAFQKSSYYLVINQAIDAITKAEILTDSEIKAILRSVNKS